MSAITLIEEFGVSIKNLLNKGTATAKNTLLLQGKTDAQLVSEITKTDIGLDLIPNFPPATQQEAEEGIREDRLSTANSVGQFVDGVFTVNENALYFFTESNTPMAIEAGSLAAPAGIVIEQTDQQYIVNLNSNPYNLTWLYNLTLGHYLLWNGTQWILQPSGSVQLNELLDVGKFYFNPYTNKLFFYNLDGTMVRF